MSSTLYDHSFFERKTEQSVRAAQAILPYVIDLLHPRSIIDVGCGIGHWLGVASELGVTDITGMDGPYVSIGDVRFDSERFIAVDLERPIQAARTYDLAMSLEVAEHLSPQRAAGFVHDLTRLSPTVLFSAAIPGQTGEGHINEQWPDYWRELFADHDYVAIDCIRRHFWDDERVIHYYAQNSLLFVHRDASERLSQLRGVDHPLPTRVVHPRLFVSVLASMENDPPAPPSVRLDLRSLARRLRELAARSSFLRHIYGAVRRSVRRPMRIQRPTDTQGGHRAIQ